MGRPKIPLDAIPDWVERQYGLRVEVEELYSYDDLNLLLSADDGQFVLKVANAAVPRDVLDLENSAMQHLQGCDRGGWSVPRVLANRDGESIVVIDNERGEGFNARIITYLSGNLMGSIPGSYKPYLESLGTVVAELDRCLLGFKHPSADRYSQWDIRHGASVIRRYRDALGANESENVEFALGVFERLALPRFPELRTSVVHHDANDLNLVVDPSAQAVTGVFDFGDIVKSFTVADLAVACAYAMLRESDPWPCMVALVRAYHRVLPLLRCEVDVVVPMIMARLATSVTMAAYSSRLEPDNTYINVCRSDAGRILGWMREWDVERRCDDLADRVGLESRRQWSIPDILSFRHRHLGPNLSVAYRQPLKIVEGRGAWLIDESGRKYLDLVNNVCHVGHCHPSVVAAGQAQMARLNTNTRYLHEGIVDYSRALLERVPQPLTVCYFVNSGSEANELALRLARCHTGQYDVLVQQHAYHGNSGTCVDISPYKYRGPGGSGKREWVHELAIPDPYRGRYKGRSDETTQRYLADVEAELARMPHPPAAFIAESIAGVAGQVVYPPGYLDLAFKAVRRAGGVCIADEVQVGFGRVGSYVWGFETQGAVPDIMTLGKPMGNGHPMGAVVTTEAIASSFDNGMEYFNTFGGNPVSCAIGHAVLDVIDSEQLQRRALDMGRRMRAGLEQLQLRHDQIGEVRGLGLFLGVEFVLDRDDLTPATDLVARVVNAMRHEGILLSSDGPHHNVIKIKPPLVLNEPQVDHFLERMGLVLTRELGS